MKKIDWKANMFRKRYLKSVLRYILRHLNDWPDFEHSAATNEMFLLHPWAMIRPKVSAWKISIIGNWKRTFSMEGFQHPQPYLWLCMPTQVITSFCPLVRRIPVKANGLTQANLWGLGFLTRDVSTTIQPATSSLYNFHKVHWELFVMWVIHFFTFNLTWVVHPDGVQPLNYSRGISALVLASATVNTNPLTWFI